MHLAHCNELRIKNMTRDTQIQFLIDKALEKNPPSVLTDSELKWVIQFYTYNIIYKFNLLAYTWTIYYRYIYYTSEEFFLYKTTIDKWTIQHFICKMNDYPVHIFFTIALLRRFSTFWEILTSDW